MSGPQKVSFTVRRPTPISRDASSGPDSDSSSFKVPTLPRHLRDDSTPGSPLAHSGASSPKHYDDSSDEDDEPRDELVTAFDKFGAERLHKPKQAPTGPLVIPALKNKDWRELAKKRRTTNQFLPDSAKAGKTGADGSVGGLGTRERIGDGPQLSGLQPRKKEVVVKEEEDVEMKEVIKVEDTVVEKVEETEDQRALRAILASANGEETVAQIDAIPLAVSEEEAYKQDVDELPESATLEDYTRVPVEQFGAALLRGMGWKEGTAASRKGKGVVEPYIPESRPALLGIGAKEMETLDDGSSRKTKRQDKRYIPVVKKDRDGNVVDDSKDRRRDRDRDRRRDRSISPRRDSRTSSRRGSPDRRDSRFDDKYKERDRGYDRGSRDRDRDRDYRRRDKSRDGDRDRDRR